MAQIVQVPTYVAPTVALQNYSICSGLAQGAAGIYLSRQLAHYSEVPGQVLAMSILASMILTLVPVIIFVKLLEGGVTRKVSYR